ncbi:HNH endonuclease signature motif containing protein [Niallia circulans]
MTEEEKAERLRVKREKKYNETHKFINEIDYKICIICCEWKTIDNYYANKSNKVDRLHPYCKKCTIKKTSENRDIERTYELNRYYYKTRESIRENRRMSNKKMRDSGKLKAWQMKNKDKIKEYNLKRQQNKIHEISTEEWEECKNYFNYRCAYCGLKIEEHYNAYKGKLKWTDFHRDHFNHTGANDLSNCVPSCKSCNSRKSEIDFEEWYESYKEIHNEERKIKVYQWLNMDYEKYIIKI